MTIIDHSNKIELLEQDCLEEREKVNKIELDLIDIKRILCEMQEREQQQRQQQQSITSLPSGKIPTGTLPNNENQLFCEADEAPSLSTVNTTYTSVQLYEDSHKNNDHDLFKNTIPNEVINIVGYHLYRRDRINRMHGGVCMFIKDSIISQELTELQSDENVVLWLNARPRRLPRGFSSIIIGVVYHPPGADNKSMRDYMRDCLTKFQALHPNCGVIVAGDFNKFDAKSALRLFQLKRLINFPTRGPNTLDQIFTNLSEFYADAERLPPFGLSDHLTIVIPPKIRENLVNQNQKSLKSETKDQAKNLVLDGIYLIFHEPISCQMIRVVRRNQTQLRMRCHVILLLCYDC